MVTIELKNIEFVVNLPEVCPLIGESSDCNITKTLCRGYDYGWPVDCPLLHSRITIERKQTSHKPE